jgi:hypothetical protein
MTRPAQADMFGNTATAVATAMPAPTEPELDEPAQQVKPKLPSDGLDALKRLNR